MSNAYVNMAPQSAPNVTNTTDSLGGFQLGNDLGAWARILALRQAQPTTPGQGALGYRMNQQTPMQAKEDELRTAMANAQMALLAGHGGGDGWSMAGNNDPMAFRANPGMAQSVSYGGAVPQSGAMNAAGAPQSSSIWDDNLAQKWKTQGEGVSEAYGNGNPNDPSVQRAMQLQKDEEQRRAQAQRQTELAAAPEKKE